MPRWTRADITPSPIRWAAYGALAVVLTAVLTGCTAAFAGIGSGWLGLVLTAAVIVTGACAPKSSGHRGSSGGGTPVLSVEAGSSLASAPQIQFAVVRSGDASGNVSVNYATSGGRNTAANVDFTPVSGTLTFAPGQTRKIVTVPLLNNPVGGLGRSVALNLSGAAGAAIGTATAEGRLVSTQGGLDLSNPAALADLTTQGGALPGATDQGQLGFSTAVADLNGDGLPDLILGAPYASYATSYSQEGAVYAVFGQPGGFQSLPDLAALDGTNGFVVRGSAAGEHLGFSIARVGDVNGDGVDDILIGAPGFSVARGRALAVYGRPKGTPFPAQITPATLSGAGFVLVGGSPGPIYGQAGREVAGLGDVNGDGIPDFAIGAPYANSYQGSAYAIFGHAAGNPFPATVTLSALNTPGFTMVRGGGGRVGGAISAAGDVDHDGIGDILVGVPLYGGGRVYVVFGHSAASPFAATVTLGAVSGQIFELAGSGTDYAGGALAGIGDVNGDGVDDILIGAWLADPGPGLGTGEAFVVFGQPNRANFGFSAGLASLPPSSAIKFTGVAAGDATGMSVSAAGDVNGDGIPDFLIGAGYATSGYTQTGKVYVLFGHSQTSAFPSTVALGSLTFADGFRIDGPANGNLGAHTSITGAGDLNGDGMGDLLLGAPTYVPPPSYTPFGKAYVIFGGW